jgi:hypothetical protein
MIPTRHIRTADCRHINWADPVSDDSLNDGLISWWLAIANHTSGSATWRDLCGKNDGTLTNFANIGSSWRTIGRDGGFGSLEFDGSDDYVSVPQGQFDFERTQPFTVSAWIYLDSLSIDYAKIVYKRDATANKRGWQLYVAGSSEPSHPSSVGVGLTSVSSSNDIVVYSPDDTLVAGRWIHVVVVYDGSSTAAGVTFVIDGQTEATEVVRDGLSGTIAGGASMYINRPPAGEDHFAGEVSDLRIWDRVLRSEESIDYFERSQAFYPGLLNRPARRPAFVPSTGVTISPPTLTMTGSLQGAPPNISRTVNVT